MRRQKAEASKTEQEWRKLEEEHGHSMTEVKRVNKEQCDTGYFTLVLIFCCFTIMDMIYFCTTLCSYVRSSSRLSRLVVLR